MMLRGSTPARLRGNKLACSASPRVPAVTSPFPHQLPCSNQLLHRARPRQTVCVHPARIMSIAIRLGHAGRTEQRQAVFLVSQFRRGKRTIKFLRRWSAGHNAVRVSYSPFLRLWQEGSSVSQKFPRLRQFFLKLAGWPETSVALRSDGDYLTGSRHCESRR
jgi:hypothetical protein